MPTGAHLLFPVSSAQKLTGFLKFPRQSIKVILRTLIPELNNLARFGTELLLHPYLLS